MHVFQIDFTEKLLIDYRYMEANKIIPRFEFGFGLSYTTFAYSSLSVAASSDGYAITFTLRNSGDVYGTEKPQLYIGYPANAGEPPKVLRGFEEVDLKVGESKPVTFSINRRDMR